MPKPKTVIFSENKIFKMSFCQLIVSYLDQKQKPCHILDAGLNLNVNFFRFQGINYLFLNTNSSLNESSKI